MADTDSITIRVNPELAKRIKDEAQHLGVTVSAFIKMRLASYFDGVRFERTLQDEQSSKSSKGKS